MSDRRSSLSNPSADLSKAEATALRRLGAIPRRADDPDRVGPFAPVALLGSGGMGRVHLARDAEGGPGLFAVKVIRPEYAEDVRFQRRFEREALVHGKLGPPHTPRLRGTGRDGELLWMATEYIPGLDLADAVGEAGALPPAAIWRLVSGLGAALGALSAVGVVHRDLKPSNVLLSLQGTYVIDFGISKAADGGSITGTGHRVGTAAYMSPEYLRSGRSDTASDVFSLACTLLYAATGRAPFGDGTGVDVMHRVAFEQPDPEVIGPVRAADADLGALLHSCLAKDPQQRPTPQQLTDTAAAFVAAGPGWPEPLHGTIRTRQRAYEALFLLPATRAVTQRPAEDEDQEKKTAKAAPSAARAKAAAASAALTRASATVARSLKRAPARIGRAGQRAPAADASAAQRIPAADPRAEQRTPAADPRAEKRAPAVDPRAAQGTPATDLRSVPPTPATGPRPVRPTPAIDPRSEQRTVAIDPRRSDDRPALERRVGHRLALDRRVGQRPALARRPGDRAAETDPPAAQRELAAEANTPSAQGESAAEADPRPVHGAPSRIAVLLQMASARVTRPAEAAVVVPPDAELAAPLRGGPATARATTDRATTDRAATTEAPVASVGATSISTPAFAPRPHARASRAPRRVAAVAAGAALCTLAVCAFVLRSTSDSSARAVSPEAVVTAADVAPSRITGEDVTLPSGVGRGTGKPSGSAAPSGSAGGDRAGKPAAGASATPSRPAGNAPTVPSPGASASPSPSASPSATPPAGSKPPPWTTTCTFYDGFFATGFGDTGQRVVQVQCILLKRGFYRAGSDPAGVFGADTRLAVRRFQAAVGLPPDGVVRRLTWFALRLSS